MKRSMFVAALVLAGAVAGAQTQAPARQAAPAAPPGNAETGKKLFVANGCYQCHGYEGQGGSAGARLAPRPLPWAALSRYVRRPANQMPPYTEKVLPDADLAHIYAYLQSRPAAAAPASIPLLQP